MRSIPDPGFAGDDGSVDPGVSAALAAYDNAPQDRDRALGVVVALQDSRVLVPVVAVAGETALRDASSLGSSGTGEAGGLVHEKTTDMAAVLMQGRGGRRALLAFTGLERLQRWDPAARPVPVTLADAARSARQQQADALVVDVAGPVVFPLDREHLTPLAEGYRLLRLADGGWGWATGG